MDAGGDEVLNRARALMQAMNTMSMEQNIAIERATRTMTLHDGTSSSKSSSPMKNSQTEKKSNPNRLPKLKLGSTEEDSHIDTNNYSSSDNKNDTAAFRGAAISGSTLITTFTDLRNHVKRGGTISIDGTVYTIASGGELTANRIELSEDYKGATNLDAAIALTDKVKPVRFVKKASPRPISPGLLMNAVQGLEAISKMSNNNLSPSRQHASASTDASRKVKSMLPKKIKPKKEKFSEPVLTNDTGYGYSSNMAAPYTPLNTDNADYGNLPSLSSLANTSINISMLGQYQLQNPTDNIANFTAMHQSDETHQKRNRIIARMLRQRRDQERLLVQEKVEEAAVVEKRKEASEIKVAMLRDKTAQRVHLLKESKIRQQQEQEETKKQQELEMRERAATVASEEAQEKLRLMQKATIARMRRRNQELRRKEEEDRAAKDQALARLAKEKGCLVPTGALISGLRDGSAHDPANFVTNLAENNIFLARNNSVNDATVDQDNGDDEDNRGIDAMGAFVFEPRESVSEGSANKRNKNNRKSSNKKGSSSPNKRSKRSRANGADAVTNVELEKENQNAGDLGLADSLDIEPAKLQQLQQQAKQQLRQQQLFNEYGIPIPTASSGNNLPSINANTKSNRGVAFNVSKGSRKLSADDDEEWSDDSMGDNNVGKISDKFNNFDSTSKNSGDNGQNNKGPSAATGSKIPVLRSNKQQKNRSTKSSDGDNDSVVSELSFGTARDRDNVSNSIPGKADHARIAAQGQHQNQSFVPHRPPLAKSSANNADYGAGNAVGTVHQSNFQSNTTPSNNNGSNITKSSGSNSHVWRKLKPIPLAPYVPVVSSGNSIVS
jgi:hypothetical protein